MMMINLTSPLDISESPMSDSDRDLFNDFDISQWRFGNGEQSESELEHLFHVNDSAKQTIGPASLQC